jgi:transposase-like protein
MAGSIDPDLKCHSLHLHNAAITVRRKEITGDQRANELRPLCDVYAVVFMNAIYYKIRVDAKVATKAAYTCIGISLRGEVDVLGLWVSENEGPHFWLKVLNEALRG